VIITPISVCLTLLAMLAITFPLNSQSYACCLVTTKGQSLEMWPYLGRESNPGPSSPQHNFCTDYASCSDTCVWYVPWS